MVLSSSAPISASPASESPSQRPADGGDFAIAGATLKRLREALERTIFGQSRMIELALVTLLAGGHALLVGLPGLAKTRLVENLGAASGLAYARVQGAPDLMPADILGTEILDQTQASAQKQFRFLPGPVFTQLLLFDEINRASPRTQAALLQAMQERKVTTGGVTHPLPQPFHVFATQNPIEQEGTYPLPEAQLDRFLMQIDVGYPDADAERRMLMATTGAEPDLPPPAAMTAAGLQMAQRLVRVMPAGENVVDGILTLVRQARPSSTAIEAVRGNLAWGPGPRASQALLLTAKARALLDGRAAPSLDDVLTLAVPVLQHRMSLTFAARAEGVRTEEMIDLICRPLA